MKPGRKTAAIVLLFVALVLVNFLASRVPGRLDATADKIYTLSDGTKALLGKIEEPVTLEFYYSRSLKGLPVNFKNYAERVEEMLHQYVRASRGKLTLTITDPQDDTPEEERATVAGIDAQQMQTGENFMFGLSAIQADQQKTISAFSPNREQYLEYDVSQLIYSVQQVVKKKMGLITVLPLQAKNDIQSRMTRTDSPGQMVSEEWARTFDIVKIEPSATSLPADLDVMVIVHPQGLHPKLQFAIDQFLLSGKPVFLAVDPSSMYFHLNTTQLQMIQGGGNNGSSDMPTLLKGWGVNYDIDSVVGDATRPITFSLVQGRPAIRSPFFLNLRTDSINSQSVSTSNLTLMQIAEAGSVALAPGSTLSFTPLVQTTENGGDVPAEAFTDVSGNVETIATALKPTGKKTIAALVSGKFKTAFPDGEPADPVGPDGQPLPQPPAAPDAAAKAPKGPVLKEATTNSNLIMVADADFLLDMFSLNRDGSLRNDNLSFAVNAVEFLGGSQDLISVRGKRSSLRPFDVVQDIEVAANKVYGEKVKSLQAKQAEVRTKLTQLQSQAGESRQLVPSPEVAAAIDDYRKQSASVSAELREIRRNLRTDVDALKNKLLAFNLLSTPLLVVLFGLWFYRRRQRA